MWMSLQFSRGKESKGERFADMTIWAQGFSLIFLLLSWMLASNTSDALYAAMYIQRLGVACCIAFSAALAIMLFSARKVSDPVLTRLNKRLLLHGAILLILGFLLSV